MIKPSSSGTAPAQSFGGRARSGTKWLVVGFGLGQLLRLLGNVALAAILFEEAFALMAIVMAVMVGLGMFSDIGLQPSVTQHPRGDDPDFLNTAWTLQVLRGVFLFLGALALAWPLSRIYGANDPKAYALLYLIPIVALTSLIDGFRSAKVMAAGRHLKIKEVTKIDFVMGPVAISSMLLLAWYLRSVYALAIASVLASALHLVLSYRMLDGEKSRFRWDPSAVKSIISFGKWVFLSTLIGFLAVQLDRLALAGMFSLAEVGVYSIAASLAVIVPTLVGKLQWAVLFPWYSRMLDEGMPLQQAFTRTRTATMASASFLCALLISGATSFFAMAYDDRYAMGGVLLPILALGAWFSSMETMYGATFMASGRPKWIAFTNACKIVPYALLLVLVSVFDLDIVVAAAFFSLSDVLRWFVCQVLGWRLGLRDPKPEWAMLAFFLATSFAGWWLVTHAPVVSGLAPFWRLAVLGSAMTLVFSPLFLRFVLPVFQKR